MGTAVTYLTTIGDRYSRGWPTSCYFITTRDLYTSLRTSAARLYRHIVTGGWWGSARNQLWIYLAWFSLWSRWNLKLDIDLFWLVNRHNKIMLNYYASTITVHLRMLVHSSVFITEYTSVGWELISFCKFRSGHYNLCILSVFLPKLSIVKTRKKGLKERVQTQTAIEKNTMWGGHNNINDALRAIHKINGYWLFVSLTSVIRLWQQPVTFVEQIRLQIRGRSENWNKSNSCEKCCMWVLCKFGRARTQSPRWATNCRRRCPLTEWFAHNRHSRAAKCHKTSSKRREY